MLLALFAVGESTVRGQAVTTAPLPVVGFSVLAPATTLNAGWRHRAGRLPEAAVSA